MEGFRELRHLIAHELLIYLNKSGLLLKELNMKVDGLKTWSDQEGMSTKAGAARETAIAPCEPTTRMRLRRKTL